MEPKKQFYSIEKMKLKLHEKKYFDNLKKLEEEKKVQREKLI